MYTVNSICGNYLAQIKAKQSENQPNIGPAVYCAKTLTTTATDSIIGQHVINGSDSPNEVNILKKYENSLNN